MPFCWEAEFKAENQRVVGRTSKIEPDLLGQEKQGTWGDNDIEKSKNSVQKYLPKSNKELP